MTGPSQHGYYGAVKLNGKIAAWVFLASFGSVACGGGKQEPQTVNTRDEGKAERLLERAREGQDPDRYRQLVQRFGDTKAAATGKNELAVILIAQAEKALAADDWSTAEERAQEARIYGGLDETEKARKVLDTIDDKRAQKLAEEAAATAGEGKCASALKAVAAPIRKKPRDRFKKELQKASQGALVACLAKKLGEEIETGGVDAARQMLESPDATTALSTEGYKAASDELTKLIVKKSTKAIDAKLAEKKWQEATDALDAMKSDNKLSGNEYKIAFGFVQEAIQKHLVERARAALQSKTPREDVKQIEETAKLAQWQKLPDELDRVLSLVKINIECEKVGCTIQKPQEQWAWGELGVHPPDDAAAGKKQAVKHAAKVWVIGRGNQKSLVATDDPGAVEGEALLAKAAGWVDSDFLRATDTEGWLPPTEQLVGVRIWGPLRPPEKDYHLGTVSVVDAKAKKVTVKRMSDNLDVTVELSKIRAGKLPQGLRVMAFCVDQLHPEPAKVDHVVTSDGGVPKVKVNCDKGNVTRVEIGGSLTSHADWLPARKP